MRAEIDNALLRHKIEKLQSELAEVREENIKLILMSARYQRENELMRNRLQIKFFGGKNENLTH